MELHFSGYKVCAHGKTHPGEPPLLPPGLFYHSGPHAPQRNPRVPWNTLRKLLPETHAFTRALTFAMF